MIIPSETIIYHSGNFDLKSGYMTYFSEKIEYSRKLPPFPISIISELYCKESCDYLHKCTDSKAYKLYRDFNVIPLSSETLMNLMIKDDTIQFLNDIGKDGFVTENSFVPGQKVYWILLNDDIKYNHTVDLSCQKSVTNLLDFALIGIILIADIIMAIIILIIFITLRILRFFKRNEKFNNTLKKSFIPRKNGIRVLSWNVHFFRNHIMAYNYNNILKAIEKYDTDILFLQEVYTMWPFCPSLEEVTNDLKQLGFKDVIHDPKSGLLGAFKKSIDIYNPSFIVESLSDSRSYIKLILSNTTLINIHLEVTDELIRLEQIKRIIKDTDNTRNLLIGDFNTIKREDYRDEKWNKLLTTQRKYMFHPVVVHELETNGFVDVFSNTGKTGRVTSIYDRRVDFAFTKNLEYTNTIIDKEHGYSDHLALMVDLRI